MAEHIKSEEEELKVQKLLMKLNLPYRMKTQYTYDSTKNMIRTSSSEVFTEEDFIAFQLEDDEELNFDD